LDWGATVDPTDEWKETPLSNAALTGHFPVVRLLVERGADMRLKNEDGLNAADLARGKGYERVAGWLDSKRRRSKARTV
jgi:ankyrin repeat protein